VLAGGGRVELTGIDESSWALQEAAWNWKHLRLGGRTRRGDLGQTAAHLRAKPASNLGIILGWAVNELETHARSRLLDDLAAMVARGAHLLIVEPIARTHAPWWPLWIDRLAPLGGQALDWKVAAALPARLAELDRDAGFRRDALSARVLWCPGQSETHLG
jgi:hypothetical protein